jgi:ABC-type dipeptide/oligopeptide/nickel transport system permease component
MTRYIFKRFLISVPTLLLVVTLVFLAFQLIPGDPARMYVGVDASQEAVEQVRHDLGLDQPVWTQYVTYMSRLVHGDLGKSIYTRRSVVSELAPRFRNTLELSLAAIVFATVVGVVLGTLATVKQGTGWDRLLTVLSLFGISMPVFWLGLLLTYVFSVHWHLLPSAGNETWRHFLMPTLCLSAFSLAFITRMTRSALLEVLAQDYVRTALAKGVREAVVVGWHALRNAMLPVVTVVGLRFGYMLGGAVVTEEVFAWPGLGRLLVTAVGQRDIPLVQGALLLFGASFVLVNLLVDLVYGILDPRIRHR